MASSPRSMLQLALTTAIGAMLWTAAPAVAAETAATPGEAAAAPAQTAAPVAQQNAPAPAAPAQTVATPAVLPVIKRDPSRAARTATSSYYDRRATPIRVSPVHANQECSGFWCGRQFVFMMLGVGY